MTLTLYQIDAFTDKLFKGNPAAVVPLDSWIDEELMQNIAAENNLAETAFICPDMNEAVDFDIRWFTPVVLGGQLPLVAVNALEVLPHVKSGKLKVLAVMSTTRSAMLPDVPTIAESGFPGFEASVWYGFVAPAAAPKAIVAKLHAEVQKALQTAEVKERMTSVGGEVSLGTAEQFGALIRSERVRYEKLVREAQIKPD